MAVHRHEFPLEEMARILGVSKQGFYKLQRRKISRRQIRWETNALLIQILYEISGKTIGVRKIRRVLRRKFKIHLGHNQVWRLMKWLKIKSKRVKKFKVITTNSNHNLPVSPNLLRFVGIPDAANRVWTSDITYLRVGKSWLFLCVILDLYSRKIVGWALEDHMKTALVSSALKMAITRRKPQGGLIFHSDRGSQYASIALRELLKNNNFIQSMSRKGNCWDNAWTESWFATLKLELGEKFLSYDDAKNEIFQYIEAFYNRQRMHSALGYQSPEEFEKSVA